MQKISLLIFVNTFERGGSERQAVELIKQVDRNRFDVIVGCFHKDGALADELPNDILSLEEFPLTSFANLTAGRQAVRFMRLLRRAEVKVVQCFDFYSNVFAIPLARLARVPVVIGSRRDQNCIRTTFQKTVERMSHKLATAIVVNAGAIKDQLINEEGLPERKVKVIHNGLDISKFKTLSMHMARSYVTIAIVANLRPEKGHFVFLEAAKRLLMMGIRAHFVIAGDGVMRTAIEEKIKYLSLNDDVRWAGEVQNIPAFLQSVDIVVLSSFNESFPNAVIEAMAAAKPVVATNVGGVPELVVDGLTGYLVPPGDSHALAERLAHLCREPEMSRKMGEAGSHRVLQLFTSDKMARQFEELYRTLLRTKRSERLLAT